MNTMKVYISLPISGRPIEQARRQAALMVAKLLSQGHTPVNPFDIYPGRNPTYADYICSDLRALADCDAIMLCEGWRESRGCRIEEHFARQMDKIIMEEE